MPPMSQVPPPPPAPLLHSHMYWIDSRPYNENCVHCSTNHPSPPQEKTIPRFPHPHPTCPTHPYPALTQQSPPLNPSWILQKQNWHAAGHPMHMVGLYSLVPLTPELRGCHLSSCPPPPKPPTHPRPPRHHPPTLTQQSLSLCTDGPPE